jgi:hypothetical protein
MQTSKYRVHRFDLRMTADQTKLEQFLNSLEGEIIAIVPNVTMNALWVHKIDFLLIVEKVV